MPAIRSPHIFLIIMALTLFASIGVAELQNHGPDGEYFYDTTTGLYWFDSSYFNGQARVTLDLLAGYSTVWSWATSAEVDALLGQTAETGSSMEDVMGLRYSTIGSGGPRWLGFYFGSGDDGWLVQSNDAPDFVTITATGAQGNAAHLAAGSWYVAAVDPMPNTAMLENDGIYFHDLSTDLYWYDPSEFFSFTRSDIEGWLLSNTDWRWATEAEIYGLLGKRTTDDRPLIEVIGTQSFTLGNGGPRWIGYFAENGIQDGRLLQSGIAPGFNILDTGSTQTNAQASNPGAWLVTDADPTASEDASWGDVKKDYR